MNDAKDHELKITEGDGLPHESTGPDAPIHPVDETIGTEARILFKSIRVPAEGSLSEEHRAQIIDVVNNHIALHKIQQKTVAHAIGQKSDGAVSEVLRGIYQADPSNLLRKLNTWVDDDERRRQRAQPIGYVVTGVAQSMRDAANWVKARATVPDSNRKMVATPELAHIVICHGPAGIGKSISAAALNAEDPLSILVRAESQSLTAPALARLVATALGCRVLPRSMTATRFVIERLRGSGRLLIFDEAGRIQFSGLEWIRDVADIAGIPIMLIATDELADHIAAVRSRTGRMKYDQFARRVGLTIDLTKGTDGKGGTKRPIFSLDEIRAIFRADGVRLTNDAVEWLRDCACTPGSGCLGTAMNIFHMAVAGATRGTKEITLGLLLKIASRTLASAGCNPDEQLNQIAATQKLNRGLNPQFRAAEVG